MRRRVKTQPWSESAVGRKCDSCGVVSLRGVRLVGELGATHADAPFVVTFCRYCALTVASQIEREIERPSA